MPDKIINLLPTLVNERTGLIRKLEPVKTSFLPLKLYLYSAVLSIHPQNKPFDLNPLSISGAGKNEQEAIAKCLAEAIERYCGYFSPYWKELIYASYQEIEDEAIEPERFALFSESQYKTPEFYFKPFTRKTKIHWVRGRELSSGKNCWLPAQLCFLSQFLFPETRIGYASSNGLASGLGYEDAVERAISEVIERDAFMITWLNQLKFPLLKIEFQNNCWLNRTFTTLHSTHYRPYTFILNNASGIPVSLSIILNIKRASPLVSFGASADLDMNKAIEKSIIESLQCLNYLFRCKEVNKKVGFKNGKPLIRNFSEHALLYSQPNRYNQVSFLFENGPGRKKHVFYPPENGPAGDKLNKMVELLKQRGYEIIIVDLTPEEFRKLGLWVVKAIIPEFINLSLGNWIYKGGGRIYEVPEKIGFKRKTEAQLYTELHPFP